VKRRFILVIGILLFLVGVVGWYLDSLNQNARVEVYHLVPTQTPREIEVIETLVFVPTETLVFTKTPEPISTVTPTPTPLVKNYVLLGSVDLASGLPAALMIDLGNGVILPSNWAGAVAFSEGDDEDIFLPANGIIYSYEDEGLPVTWAHSGVTKLGQRFFASNLEIYLRKSSDGSVLSLLEAVALGESLIGRTAYVCQDVSGKAVPLYDFDPSLGCEGELVELEVIAFALVPHEMVPEYDQYSLGIWSWLTSQFPESGFGSMSSGDSWMMRFCIGKFADQISDGTKSYLYNRGVIGFRVKDGE